MTENVEPTPTAEHEASNVASLVTAAQALVDAVNMDDNGAMVGGIWQGGNGGLLSRETIKAADALRQVLEGWQGN